MEQETEFQRFGSIRRMPFWKRRVSSGDVAADLDTITGRVSSLAIAEVPIFYTRRQGDEMCGRRQWGWELQKTMPMIRTSTAT